MDKPQCIKKRVANATLRLIEPILQVSSVVLRRLYPLAIPARVHTSGVQSLEPRQRTLDQLYSCLVDSRRLSSALPLFQSALVTPTSRTTERKVAPSSRTASRSMDSLTRRVVLREGEVHRPLSQRLQKQISTSGSISGKDTSGFVSRSCLQWPCACLDNHTPPLLHP